MELLSIVRITEVSVFTIYSKGILSFFSRTEASYPAQVYEGERDIVVNNVAQGTNLVLSKVDLFDATQAEISLLKAQGKTVVCYFSAGSYENWRPDIALFPQSVIGLKLSGTSYLNRLADTAHYFGKLVALKNCGDLIPQLVTSFDFSVAEECVVYNECGIYSPFISAGKAVFERPWPFRDRHIDQKNGSECLELASSLELDAARTGDGLRAVGSDAGRLGKRVDLEAWIEKQKTFGWPEIAIALKSGQNANMERLELQVNTTLSSVRNLILVGDATITVGGLKMINVLEGIDVEFLDKLMYSGATGDGEEHWETDKEKTLGWRVDAHKNLPGLRLLRERYPDASWYVMIDDDTHLFLHNLLSELGQLDASRPVYLGRATQFSGCAGVVDTRASIWMAQGGAGIILSRPAMDLLVEALPKCRLSTSTCWAGDIRVALCLYMAGVILEQDTRLFSIYNSQSPEDTMFPWPKDPCVRPASFHAVSTAALKHLHEIEQLSPNPSSASVFSFFNPDMVSLPEFIENTALQHYGFSTLRVFSAGECRMQCIDEPRCRTWSFSAEEGGGRRPDAKGVCWLHEDPGWWGRRKVGATSGMVAGRYTCR
ncbi:hypothetical protein HDU93_008908 [Gonapodya sp. JEL0774]|nr:hypothetical protein HDU93_008908 [Gonapodya sp. JEL0774]